MTSELPAPRPIPPKRIEVRPQDVRQRRREPERPDTLVHAVSAFLLLATVITLIGLLALMVLVLAANWLQPGL